MGERRGGGGKDFISGLAVLWFFLSRHPCRVVTTSADHSQLEAVLWGEVRRFISTSEVPLNAEKGGPLIVNHLHLRKVVNGQVCGLSYCVGRVAAKGEGMLGHHVAETGDGIPRTLFVADEASGVDDVSYERASTWARRKLVIGNPYPCQNFFRWAVKGNPATGRPGGDVPRGEPWTPTSGTDATGSSTATTSTPGADIPGAPPSNPGPSSPRSSIGGNSGSGYHRKIIRIKGEQSPNVRYALAQISRGVRPTGEVILEGVLPYADYAHRRATWDPVRQCVGLDAEFWEGADALMFPPQWLDRANRVHLSFQGKVRRARAIGIDPAEGGDRTVMTAADEYGSLEQVSKRTPDTSVIVNEAVAFMRKHQVPPEAVLFDRGGGGKQHADRLKELGFPVRTVGFGEAVVPDPKRGLTTLDVRKDQRAEQYEYKNRRAQLYGVLRELLDPGLNPDGYGLPPELTELRRQLAPIPLTYDPEGRLVLLPKDVPPGADKAQKEKLTLKKLLGCSPDEADSAVLAVYGVVYRQLRPVAGA